VSRIKERKFDINISKKEKTVRAVAIVGPYGYNSIASRQECDEEFNRLTEQYPEYEVALYIERQCKETGRCSNDLYKKSNPKKKRVEKERREMAASNTKDCFREFVGQTVRGVMFDALPISDARLASGTKTLVFEDGRGLTISSSGTFWIESIKDIKAAVKVQRERLVQAEKDVKDVLILAGESA
jgi:hypothetical protein